METPLNAGSFYWRKPHLVFLLTFDNAGRASRWKKHKYYITSSNSGPRLQNLGPFLFLLGKGTACSFDNMSFSTSVWCCGFVIICTSIVTSNQWHAFSDNCSAFCNWFIKPIIIHVGRMKYISYKVCHIKVCCWKLANKCCRVGGSLLVKKSILAVSLCLSSGSRRGCHVLAIQPNPAAKELASLFSPTFPGHTMKSWPSIITPTLFCWEKLWF